MFPHLNPQARPIFNDTELPFNSHIATQPATSGVVSECKENECKEAPEQPATDDELYPYLILAMVQAI
jgi:hypothetical protein